MPYRYKKTVNGISQELEFGAFDELVLYMIVENELTLEQAKALLQKDAPKAFEFSKG